MHSCSIGLVCDQARSLWLMVVVMTVMMVNIDLSEVIHQDIEGFW